MARLFECDSNSTITADIEAGGSVLAEALDHEKAEPVIRCAVLMALSALAEGGPWPMMALQAMGAFMKNMKTEVHLDNLT